MASLLPHPQMRKDPPLWVVATIAVWAVAMVAGHELYERLTPDAELSDALELQQFVVDLTLLGGLALPQLGAALLTGISPPKLVALAVGVLAIGAARAADDCYLPLATTFGASVALLLWRPKPRPER